MVLGEKKIFAFFVRRASRELKKVIEFIKTARVFVWSNISSAFKGEPSSLPRSLESIHPELAREILETGVKERVEKILKGEE